MHNPAHGAAVWPHTQEQLCKSLGAFEAAVPAFKQEPEVDAIIRSVGRPSEKPQDLVNTAREPSQLLGVCRSGV